MSGEEPATRADFVGLAAEFRAGFESIAPALHRLAELTRPVGQVQQFNMPQPSPAPLPSSERLIWAMAALVMVMAFIAGGAVITAMFQGQRVTDLRVDLQAERARAEAHAAWAREEAQIVRSYIWQGKVPKLNPYPNPEGTK